MTVDPLGRFATMSDSSSDALIPVEQQTIDFYGHPLVAMRLPDGRIVAVLHWLCEGLHLTIDQQVRRIRRKRALADDLLTVRVETEGGMQSVLALTLRALPGWLYTIDDSRVAAHAQDDIVLFQRECVDVLARLECTPVTGPEAKATQALVGS